MKDKYSKIKDWFSVNRVDIIAMLVLVAIITCIRPLYAIPSLLIIGVVLYVDSILDNRNRKSVSSLVERVVGRHGRYHIFGSRYKPVSYVPYQ